MEKGTEKIDFDWTGERVAILASGPSLATLDVAELQGRRVIAINDSWMKYPDSDVLYASDYAWWKYHNFCCLFRGARWSQSIAWPAGVPRFGVRVARGIRGRAITTSLDYIYTGHNSAFAALNLAAAAGAKDVEFYGLDLGLVGGRSHWFGEHPAPLRRRSPYHVFREDFTAVRGELAMRGFRVAGVNW